MIAAEASRFMQRYAKAYSAGAFAMPTAAEIERNGIRQWGDGPTLTLAADRTLTRPSRRRTWTGSTYELPPGTRIVTHLARAAGAPVPDLTDIDLVYAYREDVELSEGLAHQGRSVWATTITAASEIIAVWARPGMDCFPVADVDRVTVAVLEVRDQDRLCAQAEAEIAAVGSWHDDYPYYSDGSWSAISLRGFDRNDPTWGVKPAEMGRKWHAAHPGAIDYQCEWTTFAEKCPALVEIVERQPWWTRCERVRLMRMEGQHGKTRARVLRRHTDITDRAAGTADGQVVRFHIPVVTDPAIVMHNWDLDGRASTHHLAPWRTWYIDARKPHAVTNPTDVDRVHLVVDALADEDVREHIIRAERCA